MEITRRKRKGMRRGDENDERETETDVREKGYL